MQSTSWSVTPRCPLPRSRPGWGPAVKTPRSRRPPKAGWRSATREARFLKKTSLISIVLDRPWARNIYPCLINPEIDRAVREGPRETSPK
eukprot:1502378-Pyramimonas_sp.AAC.1